MKSSHLPVLSVRFCALALAGLFCLVSVGCDTTKDASGTTTTTVNATGNAAIQAAVQIATVAATAAIQTYLASPQVPHARLASTNPALEAAKSVTERDIGKAVPALSAAQVHKVVSDAYAKALRNPR